MDISHAQAMFIPKTINQSLKPFLMPEFTYRKPVELCDNALGKSPVFQSTWLPWEIPFTGQVSKEKILKNKRIKPEFILNREEQLLFILTSEIMEIFVDSKS